jgi:hypothetical protein
MTLLHGATRPAVTLLHGCYKPPLFHAVQACNGPGASRLTARHCGLVANGVDRGPRYRVTQNPPLATACRFESDLRHRRNYWIIRLLAPLPPSSPPGPCYTVATSCDNVAPGCDRLREGGANG